MILDSCSSQRFQRQSPLQRGAILPPKHEGCVSASPQLLTSLRVSTSGHAGDRAALGQELGAPGTHLAQAGPERAPLHSCPAALPPGQGARRSSRKEAVLPSERLRFRLRCRHFAVRQQRSGPCDAVHRGVRIRALPARDGLRAGGARAALPVLAVHLQRRVRGPGGQRTGWGTLGPGRGARGRAGLELPRLTPASPRCSARVYFLSRSPPCRERAAAQGRAALGLALRPCSLSGCSCLSMLLLERSGFRNFH